MSWHRKPPKISENGGRKVPEIDFKQNTSLSKLQSRDWKLSEKTLINFDIKQSIPEETSYQQDNMQSNRRDDQSISIYQEEVQNNKETKITKNKSSKKNSKPNDSRPDDLKTKDKSLGRNIDNQSNSRSPKQPKQSTTRIDLSLRQDNGSRQRGTSKSNSKQMLGFVVKVYQQEQHYSDQESPDQSEGTPINKSEIVHKRKN